MSKRIRNVLLVVLLLVLVVLKFLLDVSSFSIAFIIICCCFLLLLVCYLLTNHKLDGGELLFTFGFMGLILVLLVVKLLVF